MNDYAIDVEVRAVASTHNHCVYDMCYALDYVVKVAIPETKYHDGKTPTTKYKPLWMCKECRDKFIKAISNPSNET